MNAREKLEANDQRERIFERDEWTCQACQRFLREGMPQVAHRIPKGPRWVKQYGQAVISHPLNLISVCSLPCNDSFDLSGKPQDRSHLVARIMAARGKA